MFYHVLRWWIKYFSRKHCYKLNLHYWSIYIFHVLSITSTYLQFRVVFISFSLELTRTQKSICQSQVRRCWLVLICTQKTTKVIWRRPESLTPFKNAFALVIIEQDTDGMMGGGVARPGKKQHSINVKTHREREREREWE